MRLLDDHPCLKMAARAALGFAFCLALNLWSNHRYANRGWPGDDFAEFYAAGKLAGTGHLYDYTAVHVVEREYQIGQFNLPYLRLPFEAWLLKSIAIFPFRVAKAIWYTVEAAVVLLAIWLWPIAGFSRKLMIAGWFFPVTNCVVYGQDAVFFLLFAALGARWLVLKRESLAGLAFGCCFFKFHLGLGIALMLLATFRWRAIAAALVAVSAEVGASFLVEPQWLNDYWQAIRLPSADQAISTMPTLRGLTSSLPAYGPIVWIVLAAAVLIALRRAVRKQDAALSVALALAAGVMVTPHAFVYDLVIVLPLVTYYSESARKNVRWLTWQLRFPPLFQLSFLTDNGLGFAVTQLFTVVVLGAVIFSAATERFSRVCDS